MAGVDADRGARAAVGRIRHGPRREDALRRARPAARLRGAPDDRRLSRELRLDAGLAPPAGRAPPLVPQHGEPAPGGGAGVGDADRLRRRGLRSTPCESSGSWHGAATTGRSSSPSRSPTRTIPGRCGRATGICTTAWTWAEPRQARRRILTACACGTCAGSTSGRSPRRRSSGPGGPTSRRSATPTSASARSSRRSRRAVTPTTRSSSSPPITASSWASTGSGTRCRSSTRPRACR